MKNPKEFLQESNAIEAVYDSASFKTARKAWKYIIGQEKITDEIVKKTHEILMKDHLSAKDVGHYRKHPVFIGGREGLRSHFIPQAMELWCMDAWLFPYSWKAHHVRFEKIHPFIDGNGRMGRILLNWQRASVDLPLLVIKESGKFDYYKWFEKGGESNG